MSNYESFIPDEAALERRLRQRHFMGAVWRTLFMVAIFIALISLTMLMYNIARSAFGVVAENFQNDPDELANLFLTVPQDFDQLDDEQKQTVNAAFWDSNTLGLRLLVAQYALDIDRDDRESLREVVSQPVGELFEEGQYDPVLADRTFGIAGDHLTSEEYTDILFRSLGSESFREFMIIEIGEDVNITTAGEFSYDLDELSTEILGRAPAPASLTFDDLTEEQLAEIAAKRWDDSNDGKNLMRTAVINTLYGVTSQSNRDEFLRLATTPLNELFEEGQYPRNLADAELRNLSVQQYESLLPLVMDLPILRQFVLTYVADLRIVESWHLNEGLFNYDEIEAEVETDNVAFDAAVAEIQAEGRELEDDEVVELRELYPLADSQLKWYSWVNADFFRNPMNSRAELAGIRTAILGSIWMITMTIMFAFPLGVGAAIYLEEYATKNRINSLIQTNIYNLAGVPSIIYGILGLAVFVRALEFLTSGELFGYGDPTTANGRTIISASLTMSLLILPIIIINGQEAIKAVPSSIRQASYGLGATKWQTVWNHVLPQSLPGILTGTILAVSRAIGETAPLIVVGAAAYITANPDSPFAKFTVIPIQIYRWTVEPEQEFRDASAAAIVVLLALLLTLNSVAILLRNRFSSR